MNNVEKDRVESNCKRNVIIKVSFQLSLKKESTINDKSKASLFFTELEEISFQNLM